MKLISGVKRASVLLAVVVAAGVGNTAFAAGPTLKSGDIPQAGLWYGRAGGVVCDCDAAEPLLRGHYFPSDTCESFRFVRIVEQKAIGLRQDSRKR